MAEPHTGGSSEGPATDASNTPVVDPTQNVRELFDAASRRLDDLVRMSIERQDDLREQESAHLREILTLRAEHARDLRELETARIDAIRAVDVGAVNRAAEVAATQATTLASQVAISAETLRTQVAAAASAATVALAAALEPVQKDIADLRRAQYEAQGQKAQTTDTRLNVGAILGAVSVALVIIFGVLAILLAR